MLEYMLLRPIERPIFEKTREWLASDPRNKFTLVLDEAHMYRGVGGAEVGLLIRRLMSRLGISRDRLQCILTSASLGGGSESDQAGRRFGSDLTGETDHRQFVVVRGEREARNGARPGTTHEASVLARVNPSVLAAADFAKADVNETLAELSQALGWAVAPDVALKDGRAARQHIGQQLTLRNWQKSCFPNLKLRRLSERPTDYWRSEPLVGGASQAGMSNLYFQHVFTSYFAAFHPNMPA
jgi:hypothetical protein